MYMYSGVGNSDLYFYAAMAWNDFPKGKQGLNRFKPSSKVFAGVFFCGSFMLFLSCFVMLSCTSVC